MLVQHLAKLVGIDMGHIAFEIFKECHKLARCCMVTEYAQIETLKIGDQILDKCLLEHRCVRFSVKSDDRVEVVDTHQNERRTLSSP
ncbi:hypothetical protein D1872_270820 [compost metagenome]